MNQFESLYVVWTLEPDYAKEYFYKIYGDWKGFLQKVRPTKEQKEKALKICKDKI